MNTRDFHFPSDRQESDLTYHEFINNSALRTGIYTLKPGEPDRQTPHTQDEVYYVLQGKSSMQIADHEFEVQEGDCIYVPAYIEHRFVNIREELRLLVFFSKVEITAPASHG